MNTQKACAPGRRLPLTGVALFLDLDGTLADLERAPSDVGPVAAHPGLASAVDLESLAWAA